MCRALFLLAAALSTLVCFPATSRAWCPMTTEQGLVPNASDEPCPEGDTVLRWRRRCISYAVDQQGADGLPAEELLSTVRASFVTWMEVLCDGVKSGPRVGEQEERSNCQQGEICRNGNVNTIAFLRDWSEASGVAEVFAQTVTSADTNSGEILDVDILVNDDDRDFADCSVAGNCAGGQTDLQSVIAHEAGHLFGLGHASTFETSLQETRAATMFDAMDPGDTDKRTLEQDDINGFCALYPPEDFPDAECTDRDFTPIFGLRLDCETRKCDSLSGGCGCQTLSGSPVQSAAYLLYLLAPVAFFLRRLRPAQKDRQRFTK